MITNGHKWEVLVNHVARKKRIPMSCIALHHSRKSTIKYEVIDSLTVKPTNCDCKRYCHLAWYLHQYRAKWVVPSQTNRWWLYGLVSCEIDSFVTDRNPGYLKYLSGEGSAISPMILGVKWIPRGPVGSDVISSTRGIKVLFVTRRLHSERFNFVVELKF